MTRSRWEDPFLSKSHASLNSTYHPSGFNTVLQMEKAWLLRLSSWFLFSDCLIKTTLTIISDDEYAFQSVWSRCRFVSRVPRSELTPEAEAFLIWQARIGEFCNSLLGRLFQKGFIYSNRWDERVGLSLCSIAHVASDMKHESRNLARRCA